ncbi:alpha-ketoglutarate-dependent dioxygenase AlkB family protein [Fulvivirga lutea]|uniref:Alpha-ketoglutarate-dependent dioxygenase AlkB n=1 Tax=Fulvivirga lutea TaxID=2810512 RepID=A0A975A1X5_9BACT|nr:alpha-ketoglutarate-dependent dioxygenase AlkB [Fulvivirga lutea]QSE98889.1 alpha-ketoglutarate-dependent dioxygenase AlkB [Fulvivirga lutea]
MLFDFPHDPKKNLLPFDGEVYYYGKVINQQDADNYFKVLMETLEWRNDEAYIFGKHYVTKRKYGWYGSRPYEYKYSNSIKKALPWTKELKELKNLTEKVTSESYNSCLTNLYHDGSEGMAYHSDGEKDLKPNGAIASLTFGAERKFLFKHIESGETVTTFLEHGSLLVMKGTCQTYWKHRLPLTKKVHSPRVNLTFRTIVE